MSEVEDENLRIIDQQKNFCDWLYLEIKPFLKGDIFNHNIRKVILLALNEIGLF